MNIFTEILILFSISYFIGSIPFGLILTNLWGYGDIRKIGSGNIGATNALRTGNKILALLVLLLDAFKSLFLIILFKYFELTNDNATYLFILLSGSIIGHCFPIWLKFKGGKGVAAYLGILFGLNFSYALVFILSWLTIIFVTKYVSLGSIVSSLIVLLLNVYLEGFNNSIMLFLFLLLIIYSHRTNIGRLKSGTENKINL